MTFKGGIASVAPPGGHTAAVAARMLAFIQVGGSSPSYADSSGNITRRVGQPGSTGWQPFLKKLYASGTGNSNMTGWGCTGTMFWGIWGLGAAGTTNTEINGDGYQICVTQGVTKLTGTSGSGGEAAGFSTTMARLKAGTLVVGGTNLTGGVAHRVIHYTGRVTTAASFTGLSDAAWDALATGGIQPTLDAGCAIAIDSTSEITSADTYKAAWWRSITAADRYMETWPGGTNDGYWPGENVVLNESNWNSIKAGYVGNAAGILSKRQNKGEVIIIVATAGRTLAQQKTATVNLLNETSGTASGGTGGTALNFKVAAPIRDFARGGSAYSLANIAALVN